jgi:hypothetical protein
MSCDSSPRLMAQGSSEAVTCLVALALDSGQRQGHHVSYGSSSRLLAQNSSKAVMSPVAPAPASCLRTASELPRVPWLQFSSLGSGQLRSCHMSY